MEFLTKKEGSMYLSSSVIFLLGSLFVICICFSVAVLLYYSEIKENAFKKGVNSAINKGRGKPIEEINEILDGKKVRILNFIPENNFALLLVETKSEDNNGEGIFFCRVLNWSTDGNFHSSPHSGKSYKIFVNIDGVVEFTST